MGPELEHDEIDYCNFNKISLIKECENGVKASNLKFFFSFIHYIYWIICVIDKN